MFLRDVVLVEARSPLSRFGVHGMRDPAGMIADMLGARPVTLFYYGSGRSWDSDYHAKVFRDGRRYLIVHQDAVIGEVDAKAVIVTRSKDISGSEMTLGCRNGMFVLYDHRCGILHEVWRGGRCPFGDRSAFVINFASHEFPNIAEVVAGGPHWNYAVMFKSGNVKLVQHMSETVGHFCAWESRKLIWITDKWRPPLPRRGTRVRDCTRFVIR